MSTIVNTSLYVCESSLPSPRANGVQIAHMCSAFGNLARTCTLAFPRLPAALTPPLIASYYGVQPTFTEHAIPVPRRRLKIVPVVLGVRRLCRLTPPQVMYSRSLASALFAPRRGTRIGFEAHSLPASTQSSTGLLWLLLSRRPDIRVVAISSALRDRIVQSYPSMAARTFVYHDCAALSDVQHDDPDPVRWADLAKRVVYCGSVSLGKGVGTVVEVARALPSHVFTIIGGTDEEVRLVTASPLPPNLRCTGHIPHRQIAPLLRQHGLALLPNQPVMIPYGGGSNIAAYNSPLKLFEYMANGNVILASQMPNLRECVAEDGAEWIAPLDVSGWVNAVRRAADYSVAITRIRQNRAHVLSRYNWDARARQIFDWLLE